MQTRQTVEQAANKGVSVIPAVVNEEPAFIPPTDPKGLLDMVKDLAPWQERSLIKSVDEKGNLVIRNAEFANEEALWMLTLRFELGSASLRPLSRRAAPLGKDFVVPFKSQEAMQKFYEKIRDMKTNMTSASSRQSLQRFRELTDSLPESAKSVKPVRGRRAVSQKEVRHGLSR